MTKNFELPRIVYHGTTTEHFLSLRNIDFGKCSKFADFGKGFYTTSNYEQAYSFAYMKAKEHNIDEENAKLLLPKYELNLVKPLIIFYSIDVKNLNKLNGCVFNKPDKKWAEFIYNNRLGLNNIMSDFHNWKSSYDYGFGHIADSIISPLISEVRSGKISFEEFYKRIQPFDKINGNQLSFHTYESLKCIKNYKAEIGGITHEKYSK